MYSIIKKIKDSGYDGFVSIEFEGIEECLLASATGLANAKRIFAEV
jgi:sugar phosphate isomerase/epimerase